MCFLSLFDFSLLVHMFININIRATLQQKANLVLYKKKGYLVLKDYLAHY